MSSLQDFLSALHVDMHGGPSTITRIPRASFVVMKRILALTPLEDRALAHEASTHYSVHMNETLRDANGAKTVLGRCYAVGLWEEIVQQAGCTESLVNVISLTPATLHCSYVETR